MVADLNEKSSFPGTALTKPNEVVQQLEAINEQFDEAFNKHDAIAMAVFYTANAILSSQLAVASGLPDIGRWDWPHLNQWAKRIVLQLPFTKTS